MSSIICLAGHATCREEALRNLREDGDADTRENSVEACDDLVLLLLDPVDIGNLFVDSLLVSEVVLQRKNKSLCWSFEYDDASETRILISMILWYCDQWCVRA